VNFTFTDQLLDPNSTLEERKERDLPKALGNYLIPGSNIRRNTYVNKKYFKRQGGGKKENKRLSSWGLGPSLIKKKGCAKLRQLASHFAKNRAKDGKPPGKTELTYTSDAHGTPRGRKNHCAKRGKHRARRPVNPKPGKKVEGLQRIFVPAQHTKETALT